MFTFVLVALSLAGAAGVGEVVVRVVAPQKLAVNVTQWDPDVGFSNIPGIKEYAVKPEYRMYVTINSHGLRDREFRYSKAPGTLRVGVFGDSLTFGEGVQNEETYSKRLETFLQRRPELTARGVKVEVLNFGIGKTGTSHQLAWYRKLGHKFALDVVVLGLYAGNDFGENWAGVYALRNGALEHNVTGYSSVRRIQRVLMSTPIYPWAARRSHLVNLFRVAATTYDDRRRAGRAAALNTVAGDAENTAATAASEAELATRRYQLTLKLIEAFRADVEGNGGDFIVMNIPGRGQKSLENYLVLPPGEFLAQLDRLKRDLRDRDIAVVDLVGIFENRPAAASYYFVQDGHLNARGHDETGRVLSDYVLPVLLRRADPPRASSRVTEDRATSAIPPRKRG